MLFETFHYMDWTKKNLDGSIRYNMAGSGFTFSDPEIFSPDLSRPFPQGLGSRIPFAVHTASLNAIRSRISERYRVPEDHVFPVAGTSLGIFLIMVAQLEPGDEVLVEKPAYEPLFKVPLSLGCKVRRFDRGLEQGFDVDPDRVRNAITPATRMIAVSDLHNPSGRTLSDQVRRALLDLAEEKGVTLFVDEVYRDFLGAEPPETIYGPGAPVVVASSLTKVYGMGGLRAGWIMGAPEVMKKAGHAMDLLHVNDPYPMVPFIDAAFERADDLRRRGIEIARAGQSLLADWFASRPELQWVAPHGGLTAFPRLPDGVTGAELSDFLKREEDTLVVPGRFFEDDRHIRIGVGGGPEVVREGLVRIGRGLDRLRG